LRQASALVAPSQFTADLVRDVYADLNIRVIPHGIREILRLPHVPSPKLRFGMIGTVSLVKGIEIIAQAWPLVAHGGKAELHVYGDSPDRRYLRLCEKAGIFFHGAYREADLPGILAEIDIGVLPSQQPETFCYALSEFFAGGVPVVGSDYGALADRIYNGVNGLKVPRDNPQAWVDALTRLVQDSALREKIARGVRAPNLLDQMAARYAALYHEVLAKRAPAAVRSEISAEQLAPVGV
jgi:glycosyltransferase involved in cell wall biosynthesis